MEHGYMVRQNLYDIDHYARISLDALKHGVDIVPDWIHHKIATARTHMKDVGHYVRYNVHMGRKYGQTTKRHEMCEGALLNISEYAMAVHKAIQGGGEPLPEWAQNKLAVVAEYMDCVGHYFEGRAGGRKYSGPAWQTQQFQKEYPGSRVYSGVEKFVDDRRGVAAVGGVRFVPPPATPGLPYRRRGEYSSRRYGVPGHPYGTPGWAGAGGVAQSPGIIRGGCNKKGLKRGRHTYGSMGYGSMGIGSMDRATE